MVERGLVGCIAMVVILGVGGCAIHRVKESAATPLFEIQPQFAEQESHPRVENPWEGSWWESFGDPELDSLVEHGLGSNFDLMSFVARVEQASALARQAGARLFPVVTVGGGYESQWDNETTAPQTRDREDSKDIGVLLGWEIDIWGRLSAARKSRVLQREASVQDWLDARLLFSSALTELYFDIKEQRRQLEVIQEQIEINESLLKITTLRFGQGQSSIVDVLQQREQLDETKARVPETEARIGQLQYSLDALLGLAPGTGKLVLDSTLSALPPFPAVGVPAMMLQRRPDLRAAQQRVLAIDHEVGEAIAEQLPTLRIGGRIDWRGDPDFGDSITSVFADLAAPLFAAGERRAEVRLRKADLDEALARYSDRFLSALVEVESALLFERKLAERLVLVQGQLETARRLLSEAQNRFIQGLTDYLPVFTSLNIVQNLERDIVAANRSVLSARVSLHRALGGPIVNPDSLAGKSNFNE